MDQCVRKHFWIYLLLFFCSTVSSQEQQGELLVTVYENNSINIDVIRTLFEKSVKLGSITFDADIHFQKEEFFYLTDFVEGAFIDAPFVTQAVGYLVKKNKFSVIKVKASFSDEGVHLHFVLHSFWTFKKVKIQGVFQGKNRFAQCYLMNRGDPFEQSKHLHSVLKIKKLLEQDGYCACKVTSSFGYDKKTKEITVYVFIAKVKRFSFGTIRVAIIGDDSFQEYKDIERHIENRLLQKISSRRYNKEMLKDEAIQIKTYLNHKELLQTHLELEEHKNKDESTVDLVWKITVQQKKSTVFFGNHFFSTKELFEKMLTFGRSAYFMPASLLAQEILSAYKHKGFWNAQVAGQEEKERSFFVIQEGSRAIIRSIEIQNASAIDPTIIKRRCFGKFLQNKYYDFQLYDEAIKKLTDLYVKFGFLSMFVAGHFFVPLEQDNEHKLVVVLDEGKQSYVSSVVIEGYPELQNQGPFKKQFSNKKILFELKIVDDQHKWLLNHFQNLGYLHPRIKSRIDMKDDEIVIVWTIEPGEKVQFGKTIMVGNFLVPFSLLKSLLGYHQGELWDQEKIKQTFKALKELDIFESITLTPDYEDKNKEKSVIAKIYSDDLYEVRLRSGLELQHVRKYQTFNGLTYKIGGTGLVRNPFDVGDLIRLDLDFAGSHREVIARYKRPVVVKVPLLCTAQVYSISYDQPGFIGSVNDIYTLVQNGFSCGIERKTKHCEWGMQSGVESMVTKIKDAQLQKSLIKAIDFQPQLVDKTVPFFFIEPTMMFEYLDNALNPTSGLLTLCSLKGMIPFQKKYRDTLFVKLTFEQSFFIPLHSVVAAFRVRFGHIFYRKLSAIMPSERFYLGGSHSLRGYEMDLAPPLGVFVDEETNEHVVPRGGKSMLNINAEIRFPIYKKVGGVIFQDFGILSGDTFDDFKPQNFLAATGFGSRFLTPLGPLRFDIGWRWKKQTPLERSYAWFLSFGQAF